MYVMKGSFTIYCGENINDQGLKWHFVLFTVLKVIF